MFRPNGSSFSYRHIEKYVTRPFLAACLLFKGRTIPIHICNSDFLHSFYESQSLHSLSLSLSRLFFVSISPVLVHHPVIFKS
jgi:hypothetical protein